MSVEQDVEKREYFEDVQHSDDVPVGKEPGARPLDESLFAAESFEDLSHEIEAVNLGGQGLSRTVSISSYGGSISETKQENEDAASNGSEEEQVRENDVNEARLKRAESIMEPVRQNSIEDMNDPEWKGHKKHVFILSEAGKPIYTRYGNEENLVTMMGLMQAIVSFVQDNNDSIRSLVAGKHKFVFLVRAPIILVAVSSGNESQSQLVLQLTYVYHQILSVLTFTQLTRIFEQRRNYDLRRLLSGTEKFIDNLLNLMSHDPSFILQSVRCLPLVNTMRDLIGQALQSAKSKDLVFAILVSDNQLVTMVRPKRFSLHPSDLHLIFNLVNASTAFRLMESWTPICLPKFDNSGYLHAHISYLDDKCNGCLLLLSTDKNAFFQLSDCRAKILEKLKRHKCVEALIEASKEGTYSIEKVGIPELWHFVYKSRSAAQFTSPEIGRPYTNDEEKERLFGQYLHLHHRIHSSLRPLKQVCLLTNKEMLLGWVTSGFEMYASFSPLISKATAMNAATRLLRWIKKEEDTLFIFNSHTF